MNNRIKREKDFADLLYNILPELYRREDANVQPNPFPLQRFFQVAGIGFNELNAKVNGHFDMYDIDRAPKEFLPYLAQMMGTDFPYEMSEGEQRKFLKVLPLLYKYKGTSRVFDYLGQSIFGESAKTESSLRELTAESPRNVIEQFVYVNGDAKGLEVKIDRYNRFAQRFRPLNTELVTIISVEYADIFNRNAFFDEELPVTVSYGEEVDTFNSTSTNDSSQNEMLIYSDTDGYNMVEAPEFEGISQVLLSDTETFPTAINDETSSYTVFDMTHTLNVGKLNSTMVLNKPIATTTR